MLVRTHEHCIFIGVISSPTGASNAVRNSTIIEELSRTYNRVDKLDFGQVFFKKTKLGKCAHLLAFIIKSLHSILSKPEAVIHVSTNPKWLVILPILSKKKFVLYMGDPFTGDISKKDSKINSILWRKTRSNCDEIFVFSPLLAKKLGNVDGPRVSFKSRPPIKNLPKMRGSGVLYLGDFSSADRDFGPVVRSFARLNQKIDLYGYGDRSVLEPLGDLCSVKKRIPSSEISKIIPDYSFMLMVLNKGGDQVPGKVYDFASAPFTVLILYENLETVEVLPHPEHYIYCLNEASEIDKALSGILSGIDK